MCVFVAVFAVSLMCSVLRVELVECSVRAWPGAVRKLWRYVYAQELLFPMDVNFIGSYIYSVKSLELNPVILPTPCGVIKPAKE